MRSPLLQRPISSRLASAGRGTQACGGSGDPAQVSDFSMSLASSVNFRHGLSRKPRISRQKWAKPPRMPIIVTAMSLLRTWMAHMLTRFALTTQVPHSGTERDQKPSFLTRLVGRVGA